MSRRKRTFTSELRTHQQGEILKVGFLRKKGHVRRNWLDRWFVLTTEGLYYYKNRADAKPIGVVPLFGSSVSEDRLQKHQYVLTCLTAEGKDYPIQASTRDEMQVWIDAIDNAKNERNKRPPGATAAPSFNPGATTSVGTGKGQSRSDSSSASNGATAKDAANKDSDDESEEDD